VSDYRELPYWFGVNHCALTVVNGVPFIETGEHVSGRW
jgi:hypothetical protein